MTRHDTPLDKVSRLKRRRDYLHNRIASNPEADLTFDKAEKSALDWAIPILLAYISTEVSHGHSSLH